MPGLCVFKRSIIQFPCTEALRFSSQRRCANTWIQRSISSRSARRVSFDQIEIREYPVGQNIVTEGEEGTEFFMVTQGKVRVSRQEGSETKTLTEFSAGDYFGEVSLIKEQPRNATVSTLEPTTCYVLNKKDLSLMTTWFTNISLNSVVTCH